MSGLDNNDEVVAPASPAVQLMQIIVDGVEVFVPYREEMYHGLFVQRVPIIDKSNLIDVTTIGSDVPEYRNAQRSYVMGVICK